MADLQIGPSNLTNHVKSINNIGGYCYPYAFDPRLTSAGFTAGTPAAYSGAWALWSGPQGGDVRAFYYAAFANTAIPREITLSAPGFHQFGASTINVGPTETTLWYKPFNTSTGFPGRIELGDDNTLSVKYTAQADQLNTWDFLYIDDNLDTDFAPSTFPANGVENTAYIVDWKFSLFDTQQSRIYLILGFTRRWGSLSSTVTPSGDLYNAVWNSSRSLMPLTPLYDYRAENNETPDNNIWNTAQAIGAYHLTTPTTAGDNHYVCINESYEAEFGKRYGWLHPTIGLRTLADYTKVVSGAAGSGDGAGETFGVWQSNFTSAATGRIESINLTLTYAFAIR